MSFIERLNLLCPLFGVSFKRDSTVVTKEMKQELVSVLVWRIFELSLTK